MLTRFVILAAVAPTSVEQQALQDAARQAKPWFSGELGLLLGALVLVVASVFFWVAFLRRRPTQQRGSIVIERAKRGENARYSPSGRRRRRKRRPEHPDNFGRNPTLGETGGLPPPRPEDQSGPSESPEPQR